MKKKIVSIMFVISMMISLPVMIKAQNETAGTMNMYSNSDFVEKEQPELTEETKQLISLYQRNPITENYLNLRNVVIKNYDAVLAKKEEKLAELRNETAGKPGGDEKVVEMEEIVQEMYITYWSRINSNMLRFTDNRLLKWNTSEAAQYDYIPVMGAGESIYIKYSTVTNAEYAEYIKATGVKAPSNWVNGNYLDGEADFPVNQVSYQDAQAYCDWLTRQDGMNTYRLPSESEWELAAGHMPKDADFNCGVNDGRTSVTQYAGITRGAHGAIDFWGNVWEWTSTERESSSETTTLGVKGGSWSSKRTECRTEYRKEGRDAASGYDDVGFRVIKVVNGEEPEEKIELSTLSAPVVTGISLASDTIELSWLPVDQAVGYQIFGYSEETGLVNMLDLVEGTSIKISGLEQGMTYCYIVQPISYIAIADNVSGEYVTRVVCGQENQISQTDRDEISSLQEINKVMILDQYGIWRYMINNQIIYDYNGMACNEYGWWKMQNGTVDFSYNGMACNEYGWWKITNGTVDFGYNGMACNEYGWWKMQNGTVDFSYNGLACNEYGWWKMQNGTVDFGYTGIASNEYGNWNVVNGLVIF